jgi:hypothetical protein
LTARTATRSPAMFREAGRNPRRAPPSHFIRRHPPRPSTKETTMPWNHPTPDHQRPDRVPAPDTAATASSALGSADRAHRRQLEKSVSWSGRERLRCLWYRLRLTVAEMNYATGERSSCRRPGSLTTPQTLSGTSTRARGSASRWIHGPPPGTTATPRPCPQARPAARPHRSRTERVPPAPRTASLTSSKDLAAPGHGRRSTGKAEWRPTENDHPGRRTSAPGGPAHRPGGHDRQSTHPAARHPVPARGLPRWSSRPPSMTGSPS